MRGKNIRSGVNEPRTNISERIGSALELPVESVLHLPLIKMAGNREFSIEGCKGIIEYSQETVKINAGKIVVKIEGSGLELKSMSDDNLVVSGYISFIHFLS